MPSGRALLSLYRFPEGRQKFPEVWVFLHLPSHVMLGMRGSGHTPPIMPLRGMAHRGILSTKALIPTTSLEYVAKICPCKITGLGLPVMSASGVERVRKPLG